MNHLKAPPDAPDADVARRIAELGPWFHNLRIGGVETAPDHFLGDFPRLKWERIAPHLPDVAGRTVLDIGCNGGFYSIEMRRRGAARVLGIDHDEHYLAQARFAARAEGADVEFRRLDTYDVGALGERFDVVLFMGVLYHLRHPLLALDLIREHVAGDVLVFQSLERGSPEVADVPAEAPFSEEAMFDAPGYPKLHFVERSYAEDWSNWWIPNRAASEAMLRAAGFRIEARVEPDVIVARVADVPYAQWGAGVAYPARGANGGAKGETP
jgi:tRNA (mo5U34)-methyltransferase